MVGGALTLDLDHVEVSSDLFVEGRQELQPVRARRHVHIDGASVLRRNLGKK